MRIAHLSDLHVLDLRGNSVGRYLNKRLTGLASLAAGRKAAHPLELAERLVADVQAAGVDHVVITGDLVNLALESELRRARAILDPLGGFEQVSVIPGNHDAYTRGSERAARFESFFGHLMWPPASPQTYPWFKDLGEVKLCGLRSVRAVAPFMAYGVVDDRELETLAGWGREGRFEGGLGIGLVHHHLHPRTWRKNWMHGLRNRDRVLRAAEQAGIRLLLHGHVHAAHRFQSGSMEVVGCGSSTWNSPHDAFRARFNVYVTDGAALLATEVHRYEPDAKRFVLAEPTS
jgi:3',5'-cyclic AMP phosphodiesterase CpdA